MKESYMTHKENGQPDFLFLINAEIEKVESTMRGPFADTPAPCFELPVSLSAPSDKPRKHPHLKASTFTDLSISVDLLSRPVRDYIRTVTESYGCSQDFVTAICLITAGIAAGKKEQLVTNPYTNYPCDFVCLVGKPSSNKTGPLKEVTSPLWENDKASYAKYVEAKKAYDQNNGENKSISVEQPVFHQHIAGDSSPESRNMLLAQGDMILIAADELKSFIDSFGRYAKGGNGSGSEVSQLLSIWSNVSFTINRKTEEARLVDNPAMSIIGGIQPALLCKTFGTDALMDSGFTQRFLFVFPEKTTFIKRCDRKRMTQETRSGWADIIDRLLCMNPQTFQLSHEAERIYADYADATDIQADAEEDDYISTVRQKMNIHVLRLAIMSHLLSDHWDEPVITGEAMTFAISVSDYFTRIHIERIYPLLRGTARLPQVMTNGDLLRAVNRQFKVKSQNSLADALGVSQQYINKTLKES